MYKNWYKISYSIKYVMLSKFVLLNLHIHIMILPTYMRMYTKFIATNTNTNSGYVSLE